jgi:uncharacterized protein YbaR (Trm112 family)/SAM-dependent methyltransferase
MTQFQMEREETLRPSRAFRESCERLLVGDRRLRTPDDLAYASRLLCDLVDNLLGEEEKATVLERVLDQLTQTATSIREGTNPWRRLSRDREAILERITQTYHFQNIRHLELGTCDAFPDHRVATIKRADGLGEFLRLDISPEFSPDVVADCTRLPFRDGAVDSISSNALFEHVAFPHDVIAESYRVLAPGGVMQVMMPFHFVQHFCPKDYLRLTPHFFEDVCRQIGFEEVYCHVNDFAGLYYTLHNFSKAALVDETVPEPWQDFYRTLHHNIIALLAMATAFDEGFQGKAAQFFVSVYCVAFKGGQFKGRGPVDEEQPCLQRMLPYLACPSTRQPLALADAHTLVSSDRLHKYPIREGIPWLLPETQHSNRTQIGRFSPTIKQHWRHVRRAWGTLRTYRSRLGRWVRRMSG